ncbi:MAG: hypothetical protein R2857_01230 [Vampirovibrionales bacterium]
MPKNYVLAPFTTMERTYLDELLGNCCHAIAHWVAHIYSPEPPTPLTANG